MIHLIDDGTLDTVFHCTGCGETFRFTFDPAFDEPDGEEAYDAFVAECLATIKDEHACDGRRTDSA
jgi:hypothetical protein